MSRPDVLVVGGGIVGAACARELAVAGLCVTLLEARTPGGGATAAGMGHIVVLDGLPAQLALTAWSRSLWAECLEVLPTAVEPARCGTLWIAATDEELEALSSRCAVFRQQGESAEILDAAQLARMEPCLRPGLAGAMWVPDDLVVYAPAATDWLLSQARAHGARVHRDRQVVGVRGGAVTCVDGSRVEAGWVVNAAGAAALGLLPRPLTGLRVRPRKGHLVVTERVPGFCRHQLVEVGYLGSAHRADGEPSVAFNLQPRPNGQVIVGSSRQLDVTDSGIQHAVLASMLRRATWFVPGLANLVSLRAWTGLRAATDDGLPIIGSVPDEPRLVLATGHEGLGITTSLATARLVADCILDRPSPIARSAFGAEASRRGELLA